jgi:predicted O-linked N-acetylglucosamine transferase (SPINDLY family)
MGAITNAFNQAAGSVAGAAIAIKHAKQQKELKEEQGMLAKEQFHEASADLTKLTGESEEAGKNLEEAAAAEKDAGKFMRSVGRDKSYSKADKAEAKKMYKKALTEKEAAERAFNELADRIEAKKAMMDRAEKIMKRTRTWGGNY